MKPQLVWKIQRYFFDLLSVNVRAMETMESCCLFNKYIMEKCHVFGNENELSVILGDVGCNVSTSLSPVQRHPAPDSTPSNKVIKKT